MLTVSVGVILIFFLSSTVSLKNTEVHVVDASLLTEHFFSLCEVRSFMLFSGIKSRQMRVCV